MVKVGDKILVTKPEWNMYDVECTVVDPNPTDEYSLAYLGEHIVVRDKKDNLLAVSEDNYVNVEEDAKKSFKVGDFFTLKERDNGTQKLLYYVFDTHTNGITFFDDFGYKRSITFDKVEQVSVDGLVKYINDLDSRVYNLSKLVENFLDLTKNDIDNLLNNYRNI